jgi:hypothetical protein
MLRIWKRCSVSTSNKTAAKFLMVAMCRHDGSDGRWSRWLGRPGRRHAQHERYVQDDGHGWRRGTVARLWTSILFFVYVGVHHVVCMLVRICIFIIITAFVLGTLCFRLICVLRCPRLAGNGVARPSPFDEERTSYQQTNARVLACQVCNTKAYQHYSQNRIENSTRAILKV